MNDTRETRPAPESKPSDAPTGGPKTPEGRFAMSNLLSDDTKLEINDVANKPVEERRQGMADVFDSKQDMLGNTTEEGKRLQMATTVNEGGKGVTIDDPGDGYHKVISYEEDQDDSQ